MEDAKRGHPDFDLREYAARRGLEFLDHGTPAGYRAAVPCHDELQANVLRGTLPGGEYGVVAHEGLEIGYSTDSADWDGTFYGERVKLEGNWNLLLGDAPSGVVHVPCTVTGVRVPETAGTHPYIRIDTRRSAPPFSFTNRTEIGNLVGADGWSVWCEPEPDPQTVERLVADPVAGLLRAHSGDGLFQIVVWWGALVLRRNGFLRAEDLDELAQAASLLAERLRDVCLPLAEPQRFDAQLPPPPSSGAGDLPPGFQPGEEWRKRAVEVAERHGLAFENPVAYHRAFPSVPVPGTAYIVLRGEIPHVGRGRLVVHRERDDVRPAIVMAAPRGTESTPPGGVPFPEHAARLEVADGLLAVWGTKSWSGYGLLDHIEEFCTSAFHVRQARISGS